MKRATRDRLLFGSGLAMTLYAFFFNPEIPEQWLFLFAAMMGLPFLLWADEKREDKG